MLPTGDGVAGGSGVGDKTGHGVAVRVGAPVGRCVARAVVSVVSMPVGAVAGFTVKVSRTAPTTRNTDATPARVSTIKPKALLR